jgi:sugar lactone lactonase YvrE
MIASVALRASLATVAMVVVTGCGSGGSTASTAPASPTAAPATAASSPVLPAGTPSTPTITVPASKQEAALAELWHATGPVPPKPCTYSPSIDAEGRTWVAVCWGSDFWVFDPKGKFIEAWGTKGSDEGQFDFAFPAAHDSIGAIAFAPDGTYYTIDAGNLRVQHFDAKRKLIKAWGSFGTGDGQFVKPTSVAVSRDGQVFVADGSRADVQVFEADGTFVRSMAKGNAGLPDQFVYLAVDAKGNAYVNQRHDILQYGLDGALALTIDVGNVCPDPEGMAFDSTGDLFVACRSDRVREATLELGPDWSVLHLCPGVGETLTVDPSGSALYVSDVESADVRKLELPSP